VVFAKHLHWETSNPSLLEQLHVMDDLWWNSPKKLHQRLCPVIRMTQTKKWLLFKRNAAEQRWTYSDSVNDFFMEQRDILPPQAVFFALISNGHDFNDFRRNFYRRAIFRGTLNVFPARFLNEAFSFFSSFVVFIVGDCFSTLFFLAHASQSWKIVIDGNR